MKMNPTKQEWTLAELLLESGATSEITEMTCAGCTNVRPDRWDFSPTPLTFIGEVSVTKVTCLECRKLNSFYLTLTPEVWQRVHNRIDNFIWGIDNPTKAPDKSDEPTRKEDPDARLRRLRDVELARVFG